MRVSPYAPAPYAASLPDAQNKLHITVLIHTDDGIRVTSQDDPEGFLPESDHSPCENGFHSDLMKAVQMRVLIAGLTEWSVDLGELHGRRYSYHLPPDVEPLLAKSLLLPVSERWQEAVSTALLGDWFAPLASTGHLKDTAIGALKSEARAAHRQLVPLWRRGTRHGRILSLDAVMADGLSFYDLVAADVDHLAHTARGVFEDERLNAVLRSLNEAERQVVFAYAAGEGTTWTEAAAVTGAADPETFGERVRRKAKRLAGEQCRRAAQRHAGAAPLRHGPSAGRIRAPRC